jgi:threonine dehydrogenase-like Zn-dependent dehydrogenase
MKELIYTAPSKLEWREGAEPAITDPGQALVRPIASAFCDLDRRIRAGLTPFQPGFAIGHEAVGEVVEVGASVTSVRRGNLVSIPWKIACGKCSQCLFGRTSACSAVRKHASYGTPVGGQWGGLFSELVNIPFADAMLVALPKGIEPAAVSSVSDNLTDAWVAARRPMAAGRKDARVLVVGGTESLGVLATQLSVAAGAAEVTYYDSDAARNEMAAKAGARIHQGDESLLHEQFDFTISATRDPEKLRTSLLALAPGGHCSCIGIIFEDPKIPLFSMYLRDVTLSVGLCSVRPHMSKVVDLVATGQCDPMSLTTVVSTDEAPEALAAHAGKVVVVRPRLFKD